VDTQRVAELQVLLEGVSLPATRQELVDYALDQDDGYRFRGDLESLPDRQYRRLDEVGEELVGVQPTSPQASPHLPRDESGLPPGGDAYTDPAAEPGAVRPDWPEDNPPQQVLEQQTAIQKTQQQRQQEGG
jgi:Protein of unknown function (DUF2795)